MGKRMGTGAGRPPRGPGGARRVVGRGRTATSTHAPVIPFAPRGTTPLIPSPSLGLRRPDRSAYAEARPADAWSALRAVATPLRGVAGWRASQATTPWPQLPAGLREPRLRAEAVREGSAVDIAPGSQAVMHCLFPEIDRAARHHVTAQQPLTPVERRTVRALRGQLSGAALRELFAPLDGTPFDSAYYLAALRRLRASVRFEPLTSAGPTIVLRSGKERSEFLVRIWFDDHTDPVLPLIRALDTTILHRHPAGRTARRLCRTLLARARVERQGEAALVVRSAMASLARRLVDLWIEVDVMLRYVDHLAALRRHGVLTSGGELWDHLATLATPVARFACAANLIRDLGLDREPCAEHWVSDVLDLIRQVALEDLRPNAQLDFGPH